MQYEDLVPITREEADAAFESNEDTYAICRSLLCVALHDPDWRWALERAVRFLDHANPEVRGVAVASIGYLARIHRKIDPAPALPILYALQADPYVAHRVRETLEDIRQFTHAA